MAAMAASNYPEHRKRQRRMSPGKRAEKYIKLKSDPEFLEKFWVNDIVGWGVRATEELRKGDFVVEYGGSVCSTEPCDGDFKFEICLGRKKMWLDASVDDGKLGRLVNDDHIAPNGIAKLFTIDGEKIPHLCIFARREINVGEEIRYNYGHGIDFPWRSKEPVCIPGDSDLQGASGKQGPQGLPGIQGSAGEICPKGDQGSPAPMGQLEPPGPPVEARPKEAPVEEQDSNGIFGAQGSSGPTGDTGSEPGFAGNPEPEGRQGPKGKSGDPGQPGYDGLIGDDGSLGAHCLDGQSGNTGFQGSAEAPGPMEEQDSNGMLGAQPSSIPTGDTGSEPGFAGKPEPEGRQGRKGNSGDPGQPGHDGLIGDDGSLGAHCLDGQSGNTGFQGSAEAPGPMEEQDSNGMLGAQPSSIPTGDTGSEPGFAGKPEPEGRQGRKGNSGEPGQPGHDRLIGDDGSLGAHCLDGQSGNTGFQGSAEAPGPMEEQDSSGMLGAQPSSIPTGDTGSEPSFAGNQEPEGRQGRKGNSGDPGQPGHDGLVGDDGSLGAHCLDGQSGNTGFQGSAEAPGPMEEQDSSGMLGAQPSSIPTGDTGSEPSFAGNQEPEGRQGRKGNSGDPGQPGHDGLIGDDGSLGAHCLDGQSGNTGFQGSTEAPGPMEEQDSNGMLGAQPSYIPTGDTGSEPGFAGKPEPEGRQGRKGNSGDPGQPRHDRLIGDDGSLGAHCLDGQSGNTGFQGSAEAPGPMEEQDSNGMLGAQPSSIPTGETGSEPGFAGKPEPEGRQGRKGYSGDPGQPGHDRLIGDDGSLGAHCLDGQSGNTGFQGSAEAPGPMEEQDSNGMLGAQPSYIPTGDTGSEPGFAGKPEPEGRQGRKGNSGDPGQPGHDGLIGDDGSLGAHCLDGQSGNTGFQGSAEAPGPMEEQDSNGMLGAQPSSIPTGDTGSEPGFAGKPEPEGRQGRKGNSGDPGQPGHDGLIGDDGSLGAHCLDGQSGNTGFQGSAEAPGPMEEQDSSGMLGAQPSSIPTGDTGSEPGFAGKPEPEGRQGRKGNSGDPGQPGHDRLIGDDGSLGAHCLDGQSGNTGFQGSAEAPGPVEEQDSNGMLGAQPSSIPTGDTGSEPGFAGNPEGREGRKGNSGDPGQPGHDGLIGDDDYMSSYPVLEPVQNNDCISDEYPCTSDSVQMDKEFYTAVPYQKQLRGNIKVFSIDGACVQIFPMFSTVCVFGRSRYCDIKVDQEGVLDHDCQIEINKDGEAFLVGYGRISNHLKHNEEFLVGRRKFIWDYPITEDVDSSEAEDYEVIIIQGANSYSSEVRNTSARIDTAASCQVSSSTNVEDLPSEKELCEVDDVGRDPTYVPDEDDWISDSESDSDDYSDIYPSLTEDASDINVRSVLQVVSRQSLRSEIEIAPSESDEMVVEPSSNMSSDAKLQPKGSPELGCKKKYDKMNWCTYCEKMIYSKITRHLLTHNDRVEILKIRMLPKRSEERAAEFSALVNEGNYKNNVKVLKSNKGTLLTMRRESPDKSHHSVEDYYPCEFCMGFCLKRLLWHHAKNCKVRKLRNGNDGNFLRNSRTLLYSALLENEDQAITPMFERMNDGEVKRIVAKDMVIKRLSAVQIAALGDTTIQKKNDMHRVSQNARTLGRLVLKARKEKPAVFLSALLKPENFDLVVRCVCHMSTQSVTLGPRIGHLIGHSIMTKSGWAIRSSDDKMLKEANGFKTLFDAEWKYVVNAACRKKKNARDVNKVTVIPETQDLVKLRNYLVEDMKDATDHLAQNPNAAVFQWLGKITLCRLLLFNKRRVAEVEDLTVEGFTKRPEWKDTEEFQKALTQTEKQLAKRMDMVESVGKSRKNQKAYVLITPETKRAVEVLIDCRKAVDVPEENKYLFARLNANTPLSGVTSLREVCKKCPDLLYPERITSTNLRKYVATVSQILDMTSNELRMLAKHMGHDVKTHKEYYQLSSATQELSKVSRMLTAVECGHINTWKDRPMSEIKLDELPYPESDEEGDNEGLEGEHEDDINGVLDVDDENPTEDVKYQTERNVLSATKRRRTLSDGEPDEEPPTKAFKHRNRTVDDEEDDDYYDNDHANETYCRETANPPVTKRGMKKRWTDIENRIFLKYFKEDIQLKKMPLASKLHKAKVELSNRTVLQIRTKINNIILGKQKLVL